MNEKKKLRLHENHGFLCFFYCFSDDKLEINESFEYNISYNFVVYSLDAYEDIRNLFNVNKCYHFLLYLCVLINFLTLQRQNTFYFPNFITQLLYFY